jgi:hypothetical protein
MFPPLDIFKTDSDGLLWRGAADTLVAAQTCIKKLAVSSPGVYFIFDQHTGRRIEVAIPSSTLESPISVKMKIEGNEFLWTRL